VEGSIRVRDCPEVDAIIEKLDALAEDFSIESQPLDHGELRVVAAGCQEVTAGTAGTLDGLLQELGPHALEAAVFNGINDYEPFEFIVAPPGEAGATAMSRLRLSQIEPLLGELVTEDRVKLIETLQATSVA
jgi:hypothetical protein